MKKIIAVSFVLFSLVFLAGCDQKSVAPEKEKSPEKTSALKICPDELIDNQMPGDNSEKNRQYYILDGQRREIDEFDQEWVKNNCQVKKDIVN
ncbi:MAG TPA: hypothetical protein VK255_03450 [Patescibacteria group bacterium]|nr:hypothetical protein [Patescibacteria group bacterium]